PSRPAEAEVIPFQSRLAADRARRSMLGLRREEAGHEERDEPEDGPAGDVLHPQPPRRPPVTGRADGESVGRGSTREGTDPATSLRLVEGPRLDLVEHLDRK